MKCPNCQSPEKVRVRQCTSCGLAYSTEDLLELRQLEYLLDETAGWEGVASYRNPYIAKLDALMKRILPPLVVEPEKELPQELPPAPEPVLEVAAVQIAAAKSAPAAKPVAIKSTPPPAEPKEKVPFDQWLLSERNIKIALYSGAVLLVLAGIIFIGVNWTRFSGGWKFFITSMVTAITYLSGYLFFRRPALKLGGDALLSIAEGFFALNFGVLQIYVLRPQGLPDDVMWLIASPLCLALYLFTAYWTKSDLFIYFSIAAAGSTLAAALVVASAPYFAFLPAFSILFILFWGLSRWLKNGTIAEMMVIPLAWVSQILMPVILFFAIVGWFSETGCTKCAWGSPFLPIVTMFIGVLFYIFTEITTKRSEIRWVSSILFTLTLGFTMTELNFSDTAMGIGLMLQSLAYLWVGYWLNQKTSAESQDWSLYVVAYIVAGYLTISVYQRSSDVLDIILVLFGDVLLLGTTSFIRRSWRWLYGAAWLALLPIYLLADMLIAEVYQQVLVMLGVGVLNFGVGYFIGRKNLIWGSPFLTSAAMLSVISVLMKANNLWVVIIVFTTWLILYVLASVWLKWSWLLVPALIAANLLVGALTNLLTPGIPSLNGYAIPYTGLGILCWIIGRKLSHIEDQDWTWHLYISGILNMVGAYLVSLIYIGWLAIGLSLALSALFLVYAAFPALKLVEKIFFPALPYLGVIILFLAHFFLVDQLELIEFWPMVTVGICGIFAAIAWLLRGRKFEAVYELPFRLGGLVLMIIPLAGAFLFYIPWVTALVFVICGAVYLADAGLRRLTWMAYPGVAVLFASHFFLRETIWPAGDDFWPVIAVGVCGLFAVTAWLLCGRKFEAVYELPFRLGGLALMVIPLAGALIISTPWMAALAFIVCGAVYLADAGLRRLTMMAYPGVAVLFVAHFFLRATVWPTGDEFWPAVTVGVCALFAATAWLLRGRKYEAVYELPFRLGGLVLMTFPLAGAVLFYTPWVAALVFVVCGAIYLADAGLRQLTLMAYPGVAVLFVAHFFLRAVVWPDGDEFWPAVTAGVCALFAVTAWLLRGRKYEAVYELPFRLGGLVLMILPLAGAFLFYIPWVAALVFVICGAVCLIDAGLRRLTWMAYPAVVILFASHFFLRETIWPEADKYWIPVAAGVSVIFIIISWVIRGRKSQPVFYTPFKLGGLALVLIPLFLIFNEVDFLKGPLLYTLTFSIAGAIYIGDALISRSPRLTYPGLFFFVVAVWAGLVHFDINELQAFVFPIGLMFLGMGWCERIWYPKGLYQVFTLTGCVIMLGTAFYQSLPRTAWEYALLVGIESIIAIYWGIRTKSRGYVQVGGIVLIANALFQFIPSFLEWSRWMQIGLTGGILLGLGLIALFRREKLLETRKKISTEWQSWNP